MEVQSVRAECPEDSKGRIKQLAETWSRPKGGSCGRIEKLRPLREESVSGFFTFARSLQIAENS